MDDNTPVDELIFEMQVNLCERFPAMTPLSLRKERAKDVFTLFTRYIKYANKKGKNKGKKKIIRRPASDTWF